MAKQSGGIFSPVLKNFPGAWSCPSGTVVLMRLYMRSMKQSGLKYSEKLSKTVKLGWCSPDLFWSLPSAIYVNSSAGVGAGESEPMHQKLSARDPDPGKKPQRQAREKHIRRFLDVAALFQIPNCLSKLNSGTSVLHVPAEEIGHSKTQLSSCHLIICTVLLVSHFLV